MKSVSTILTNALVLTMDEQFRIFEPGAVAVQDDVIVAVGPEAEITAEYTADEVVDCGRKVLMPGLVNAHTHVPMTMLRGLADDLRLDVWLLGYMMPVEREFVSPEFVRLGTLLACAEMIRSGITLFADMYYFEDDVAQATAEAGLRAVCSQSVMKFPTPDSQSYEESMAYTREFIKRWKGHPLIVPSVAPHAVYTTTDEILRATAKLALEFDVPLHIHISETELEVENLRKQEGMPVVPYVKKQNLLDTKMIAAHCVWIDAGEIRTFRNHNVGVAHNPSSNLKLASGIAPVKEMREAGLNVGIGTDGPASNNDLDMFEEIRLASFLAKGASGDPTALPARETLAMGTRIGAQALHLGEITGSLEVGKRADLILVDLSPVHNEPRFYRNPEGVYSQLVYAAKATDVSDVMVNGRWLMRNRQLLTLDENALLEQAKEYARQIDSFLLQREGSALSKLLAVGNTAEQESFEVQAKIPVESREPALAALNRPGIEIIRRRHYRQYDTYFTLSERSEGMLRYREDHFVVDNGQVTNVRSRLTLIGPAREGRFDPGVLLSRSRYIAPADQSLRFYREYFKPEAEMEIEKDRLRFLVNYQNTEFFINLDSVSKPNLGSFLEIKSRTWSLRDAERKAELMAELIKYLGADPKQAISEDYIELVGELWTGVSDA